MSEAWQHLALARRVRCGPSFGGLEAALREAARDASRRGAADEALAALADCRREFEADPLIGPLPQSELALGRALAALGPVEWSAHAGRAKVSEAERLAMATLGAMIYDLALDYPPKSRARRALMEAAHDLERDDPENARGEVLNSRWRAVVKAVYALAPFGFAGLRLGLRRKRGRHGRRS
jgi:hypothetical protein